MRAIRARKRLEGQEGFTLAEMLVVVMLMVLIVVAIAGLIRSGIQSSSANYNLTRIGEAGNEAVNVMVRQIRGAVAVSPSSDAGTLVFAADINADAANDTVQFDAAGGYLRRGSTRFGTGAPAMQNWIEGCNEVSFTYWVTDDMTKSLKQISPGSAEWEEGGNSDVVRIDFEIQISRAMVGGNTLDRTFTGSVSLRNTLTDMF